MKSQDRVKPQTGFFAVDFSEFTIMKKPDSGVPMPPLWTKPMNGTDRLKQKSAEVKGPPPVK